ARPPDNATALERKDAVIASETDAGARSDGGPPATDAAGVSAEGKVVLNVATEEDLRRLPGVGAVRARAILALRARLGRFLRGEGRGGLGGGEALLGVKGLGGRSLARLGPLVVVDPMPE